MHEGAVCTEIIGIATEVAAEHGLNKVTCVHLAVGPYSCINKEQLDFYLGVACVGTVMEGAQVSIELDESLQGTAQMCISRIEGE